MNSYKLLISLPDTLVILSPELKILEATDYYLQATMQTREKLIGKDFLAMFPDNPTERESKNRQFLRDSLEKAISTKQTDHLPTIRYDIPKPEAQGGGFEERYWEAVHKPVLDDAGQVVYVIQKTSDVTQREVARKAAEFEESKYKFMLNALPQLIYTTDAAGKATFFNQRWYDYTGTTPELLERNNWQEVIHPDDLPKVIEKIQKSIENGTEFQAETRVRNSKGSYRWFLTRSTPMRNQKGDILLWVGSSVDIHATRELVMELADSNQQMVELAEQVEQAYKKAETERMALERLIMKAPVFFSILRGPEHRFEMMNEKYQLLFPGRNLIGYPVAEILPEVEAQGFVKILDEVYTTGNEYIAEQISVSLDRYGTGKVEEMRLTFMYQAIYDEQNKVTGIMVCGYKVV